MTGHLSLRRTVRSHAKPITLAATAALLSIPAGAQQVQYDGTFFLHGINDNSARWTTKASPDRIANQVDVGQYRATPDLAGYETVAYQAKQLKNGIFPSYDGAYPLKKSVFAGLSMGGMVARDVLLDPDLTVSSPAHVGGIITIASPHRGAPIAENATKIDFYNPSQSIVEGFLDVLKSRLTSPASGLSSIAGSILTSFATDVVLNTVKKMVTDRFGLNNAAAKDLRPSSATIARLRDATDNVPHANVIGIIPKRNAVYRVASGVNYGDGETLIHRKNQVKSVTKACTQIFYNAIVKTGLGKKCHALDKFIGSVDDRWNDWTHGPDKSTPFDGFLPKDYTVYPGIPESDPRYIQVQGENHMTIQFHQPGVDGISLAMIRIGMRPAQAQPPAFTSSISGPDTYSESMSMTFTALASGGAGGYTYHWRSDASGVWNDLGNASTQSVDAPTDGTDFAIEVTVTTSSGELQQSTKSVTYRPPSCDPRALICD